MKKVLALIGSHAGLEGHTARLAAQLIAALQQVSEEEIVGEILTADAWQILPCQSCDTCFRTATCAYETKDDLTQIKDKILACDLLLLGSPVFAANVSGDLKLLIDRLAVWLHLMPLISKFAVPICTTSNNHADEVISYLTKILEYWGTSLPTSVTVYRHKGAVLFHEQDQLQAFLREQAQIIVSAFQKGPAFSSRQDTYFRLLNLKYSKELKLSENYPQFLVSGESRKWHEQGYFQYKTIHEVIHR